jgi:hypothetical protein
MICWELVFAACAPRDAVKARAALLGSGKLKAGLWATLEAVLLQIQELHQVLALRCLRQLRPVRVHLGSSGCRKNTNSEANSSVACIGA